MSLRRQNPDRCPPEYPWRCASHAGRAASADAKDRPPSLRLPPWDSSQGCISNSLRSDASRSTRPLIRELFRADAAQRRNGAVQHVIEPAKLARGLDRQNVMRLFHHADLTRGRDADRGSNWHSSPSLMLLHCAQMPSLSLTSRIACARCSASSRGARSRWNAMRCADFWPMPGSRLHSWISRASGSAKSGIVTA